MMARINKDTEKRVVTSLFFLIVGMVLASEFDNGWFMVGGFVLWYIFSDTKNIKF